MNARQAALASPLCDETSKAHAPDDSSKLGVLTAVAGYVGVLGNLLAVAFLHDMPSAYRLARLDAWVQAVSEQPSATTASSIAFTLGLIGIAGWAWVLARKLSTASASAGAGLVAFGALANAAGTLTPMVQALHVGACGLACDAVGRALLGLTLSLDALFNLTLGVGLLLMAGSVGLSNWTRRLMQLSGATAVPVALQAVWDPAASMLYVAGPLWLSLILKTSTEQLSARW